MLSGASPITRYQLTPRGAGPNVTLHELRRAFSVVRRLTFTTTPCTMVLRCFPGYPAGENGKKFGANPLRVTASQKKYWAKKKLEPVVKIAKKTVKACAEGLVTKGQGGPAAFFFQEDQEGVLKDDGEEEVPGRKSPVFSARVIFLSLFPLVSLVVDFSS